MILTNGNYVKLKRYSGNYFDGPIEIPSKIMTKVSFCIRGRKIVTGHVLWTFQYVNLSYSFEKAICRSNTRKNPRSTVETSF